MKNISLKDVAKYVGVSTALVSYVLNGQAKEKQVNEETAKTILDAAKKLNYMPNQIAKSLKIKKTNTIGLVVADINYRFTTGITKAIEEEAKKHHYTVIYGSSNENKKAFSELVNVFVNRLVDGLILLPVEKSENDIAALNKTGIPYVLVDRIFPEISSSFIALDNFKAGFQSTEYLIKRGYKRIGLINYKTSMHHLHERNRGYLSALKKYGIKDNFLKEISYKESDIKIAIDSLLSEDTKCEAIFFATDTLTLHGLKHLNDRNIRIPEDVSVLSFDGSDAFDLFYCPITHCEQPLDKMGQTAVTTLLELIRHKKMNMQLHFEAELIIGKSCGE